MTKQNEATTFQIKIKGAPESANVAGLEEAIVLEPQSETEKSFFIQVPKKGYEGGFDLTVEATVTPGDFVIEDTVEFLGPSAYILNSESEAETETTKPNENENNTASPPPAEK